MNYREKMEHFLVDKFNRRIKPLEIEDFETINKHKDNTFGFSFAGLMLYCNGMNEKAISHYAPMGLLYNDGENIMGIGIFKKGVAEKNIYVHIVAPRGKDWMKCIDEIEGNLKEYSEEKTYAIIVRHIKDNEYNELIEAGYQNIEIDPWDIQAPQEDETYNNRLVELSKIVKNEGNDIVVESLTNEEAKNYKKKTRLAYNRFRNFLSYNNAELVYEKYTPQYIDVAKSIVESHFASLKNRVGSTPQDYYNLIEKSFYEENKVYAYIGFLKIQNEKIPVSLFIGEVIGEKNVALYATFATRNIELKDDVNTIGFSAISQYCYVRIFSMLQKEGIKFADLGGSELDELNTFKKQLGAVLIDTYWAIKIC